MAFDDKAQKAGSTKDAPAHAYRSDANPRTQEDEGALKDAPQAQNGSGFKGDGTRPAQDSDWYGVKRPAPATTTAAKADPAHLAAAAAKRPV